LKPWKRRRYGFINKWYDKDEGAMGKRIAAAVTLAILAATYG